MCPVPDALPIIRHGSIFWTDLFQIAKIGIPFVIVNTYLLLYFLNKFVL